MEINDEYILSTFMLEQERGFRLLMSKYKEPIYWFVRRMVVDHADAQDVTQNTFIKVFRSADSLHEVRSLKSWLYRIATNEALSFLRGKNNGQCSIDDLKMDTPQADAYVDFDDVEAVKLQCAIATLPTKQRLACHLHYYDELSYQEMAEVMESSAATAKVNYHLAKEKIVKYMNA